MKKHDIPKPDDDPPDQQFGPSILTTEEEEEELLRNHQCADDTATEIFDQMCELIDQSMIEEKITIDRGQYHDLVMAELHNMIRMALRDNGSIHLVGEIK